MPKWVRWIGVVMIAIATAYFIIARFSSPHPLLTFPHDMDLSLDFSGTIALQRLELDGTSIQNRFHIKGTWVGTPSRQSDEALFRFSWTKLEVLDAKKRLIIAFTDEEEGVLRYQLGKHLTEGERLGLFRLLEINYHDPESYSDNSLLREKWSILFSHDGRIQEVLLPQRLTGFLLNHLTQHPLTPYAYQLLHAPFALPPLLDDHWKRGSWTTDGNFGAPIQMVHTITSQEGNLFSITSRNLNPVGEANITMRWDYDRRLHHIPHLELSLQIDREKNILGHQKAYHLMANMTIDCHFQAHAPTLPGLR